MRILCNNCFLFLVSVSANKTLLGGGGGKSTLSYVLLVDLTCQQQNSLVLTLLLVKLCIIYVCMYNQPEENVFYVLDVSDVVTVISSLGAGYPLLWQVLKVLFCVLCFVRGLRACLRVSIDNLWMASAVEINVHFSVYC